MCSLSPEVMEVGNGKLSQHILIVTGVFGVLFLIYLFCRFMQNLGTYHARKDSDFICFLYILIVMHRLVHKGVESFLVSIMSMCVL